MSKAHKILLIDYVLLIRDIEIEFKTLGHSVKKIQPRELSIDSFSAICAEFQPDIIFSINFSPPLALLASQKKVRYISWTIDPLPSERYQILEGTNKDLLLLFIHDKNEKKTFENLGLEIYFLPLAAPEKLRKPIKNKSSISSYSCNISFVGNSLGGEFLESKKNLKTLGFSREQLKNIQQWLLNFFTTDADFNNFIGFNNSSVNIPKKFFDTIQSNQKAELIDAFDGWISYLLRSERVISLEKFDIKIYGDSHWARKNLNYIGRADNGEELTKIYNASRINLDLPRIYQRNIITMRVFDVLATGNVLLSEKNDAIFDFFENDKDLITYDSSSEMVSKVKFYTKNLSKLEKIATCAREKILKEHLISHRINFIMRKYNGI